MERYKDHFGRALHPTFVDKTKTRLKQATEYMDRYASIRSLEMAHNSKMLSMTAVIFSLISLAVSFSAIIQDRTYPMCVIPVVSAAVLVLGLENLLSEKRLGPRKAFHRRR